LIGSFIVRTRASNWVSARLTTVGSQLPNPVSTPGRVIAILLSVWAITVAATLAASLAAFFRAHHVEHMERAPRAGAWSPGES
jgi:hypothetical protein